MNNYYFEIIDPLGNTIDYLTLDSVVSFTFTRKLNTFGELNLVIPYEKKYKDLFKIDTFIGIYRSINDLAPKLEGDTLWVVRKTIYEYKENNTDNFTIVAYDALSLLERRILVYNSGNQYTHKLDEADDMAKDIMRENYGNECTDPERIFPLITIEPNQSLCSVLRMEFQRNKILRILQDLAKTSYEYGSPLYFDMLYFRNKKGFTFRTYAKCRGKDLSSSSHSGKLLLGIDYGNVSEITYTVDYTNEYNYVYYGGSGVGEIMAIASAKDENRMRLSPYNRVEHYATGLESASAEELINEAKAVLNRGKPSITFTVKALNLPSFTFGIDYNFGDKLVLEHENEYYDVLVSAYTITYEDGIETVEVVLEKIGD